jgi:MYXO-CTERM domain-containing protein
LSSLRTALAVATVVAVTPGAAAGAVRTWDGGDPSQRWSAPGNWSGNAVPVPGDAVVFDATSNKNATLDVDLRGLASLTIAGYSGTISRDPAARHALSLTGDFVQSSGTFIPPPYLIVGGQFARTGGSFPAAGSTVFLTSRPSQTHRTVSTVFDKLNISDGLIAYWPLDSSVAPIRDVSGGATDLSVEGTPAPYPGIATSFTNGGGLDFNANGDGLSAPVPSLLQTPTWTVSLWFRPDQSFFDMGACGGSGANGPAAELFTAGGDYVLRACKETGGPNRVRLVFRTTSGSRDCLTSRTFVADDGNYHHVAATSDSQGNRVLYFDGSPSGCGGTDAQTFGTDPLKLARHENQSDYDFDGSLDEIRVYDRGLTAAELAPLTRGEHPPPPPGAIQTFVDPVTASELIIASRTVAFTQAPSAGLVRSIGGTSMVLPPVDAATAMPADAAVTPDGPAPTDVGAPGPDAGLVTSDGAADDVGLPAPEAGLPPSDAAPPTFDAPIAGDAAPPSAVDVKLAVGCACRTSPGDSPRGGIVLILLALALRRRSR